MIKKTAALAAAALLFVSLAALAQSPKEAINQALKSSIVANADVGIIIMDLDSGAALYSLNPDKVMIPASNMKIITSAAAILGLTTDFRFNTDFYTKKFEGASGTAYGLFVRGYGDPTLTGDFYDSAKSGLDEVAAGLYRAGLRRIEGSIYLSGTYFPDNERPESWEADDMKWCYATRPGALSVGKNCLKVTVSASGWKAAVTLDPPIDPALLSVNIKVVKKGSASAKIVQAANGKFTITGTIRNGKSAEFEYPVPNPDLFYGAALMGALKRAGISFDAKFEQSGSVPPDWRMLHRAQSPYLLVVLDEMVKNSDNFVAEQVFRALGASRGNRGGTHAGGALAVKSIMQKYKFADADSLSVVDGSGLSRLNRLTPRVLLTVLSSFYNSYLKQSFLQLFAEPGGEGTLKKRLVGTPAQGRLWAKTGALSGACSLSGYFRKSDGGMAVFVMVFNNYKVHSNEIRALQDQIALQMMQF